MKWLWKLRDWGGVRIGWCKQGQSSHEKPVGIGDLLFIYGLELKIDLLFDRPDRNENLIIWVIEIQFVCCQF